MLSVVLERPGELRRTDVPQPEHAEPGMALVQVHRIGVCGTDFHAWYGRQPFFAFPRILGHELGVEVLEVQAGASGLSAGDRCAVEPYLNCGRCPACRLGRSNCCETLQTLGVHTDGGMRERLLLPVNKLHASSVLDFDVLALVETLCIGSHAVMRSGMGAGDEALVIGAGPIGLGVALAARAVGSTVRIMDVNGARLEFARAHTGADGAIQVPGDGVADAVRAAFGGTLPRFVFDATGSAASMQGAFHLVGHAGTIVFVGLVRADISFHDPDLHRKELTVLASRNAVAADFRRVMDLLESGRIDLRPWITHRAALADVPEAFPGWTRPEAGVVKALIQV
jgi:2-desacetyl-2-hydroxyethyl bacteriochlorophyllide A dehydrogenase